MSGEKLLIVTAPSGAGKTTIVRYLLSKFAQLEFSVSATTRPKRDGEIDGKDYYFLSEKEFKRRIEAKEFAEWEEVYKGRYYGTLNTEIERKWAAGKCVVFDIDVVGAMTLQKRFPNQYISLFIAPPSPETLKERLEARGSETEETIKMRLERANMELSNQNSFSHVIVNENLDIACQEAAYVVAEFLSS